MGIPLLLPRGSLIYRNDHPYASPRGCRVGSMRQVAPCTRSLVNGKRASGAGEGPPVSTSHPDISLLWAPGGSQGVQSLGSAALAFSLTTVWPQGNYFTSLSLRFFICKLEIMVLSLQDQHAVSMKNVPESWQCVAGTPSGTLGQWDLGTGQIGTWPRRTLNNRIY